MPLLFRRSEGKVARAIRAASGFLAVAQAAGLNLLFPPRCVQCRAELAEADADVPLCDECCRLLAPDVPLCCGRCGALGAGAQYSPEGCALCRDTPLQFETVVSLGVYHGPLRQAVLQMKTSGHEPLAAAMGQLLGLRRRAALAGLHADLIVPVPMHWRRRFQRGANSPDILAQSLRRGLRLPLRQVLVRQRNTLKQTELPPRARFRNVRGAFRVRSFRALAGRRILLVDDVLTTGATCSEAAATLKQAGAAMVAVAVLARGQGRD